jgi:hypothetical protein
MTLTHIAWLRFKDDVSAERIKQHLAACRELVGKVPSLINLECGPNLTDRSGGLTHGIIVTVENREGLDQYLNHPAHVPVAAALVADVADLKVMDIQI